MENEINERKFESQEKPNEGEIKDLLSKIIDIIKNEIRKENSVKDDIHNELKKKEENNEELKQKLKLIKEEVEKLNENLEKERKEKDDIHNELKKKEKNNEELKKKLNTAEKEVEKQKKNFEKEKKEKDDIHNELKKKEKNNEELNQELKLIKEEVEKLNENLEKAKKEKDDIHNECMEKEEKNIELNQKLKSIKEEVEKLYNLIISENKKCELSETNITRDFVINDQNEKIVDYFTNYTCTSLKTNITHNKLNEKQQYIFLNEQNKVSSILQTEDNGKKDQELINKWNSLKKKPKLIVFDLDYTLWPYFVGKDVKPPIKKTTNPDNTVTVVDSIGKNLNGFKDVTKLLYTLKNYCLNESKKEYIAIASKTTKLSLANEVIDALGWTSYFSSIQAYNKPKQNHMTAILNELKMEKYEEILFFDDDPVNINDMNNSIISNVTPIQVNPTTGVDMKTFIYGLNIFESNSKLSKVDYELINKWQSLKKKPKIIVFDLEHTILPYFVNKAVTPPIKKLTNSDNTITIVDNKGKNLNPFKDVDKILYTLKNYCLNKSNQEYLAIASRSSKKDLAIDIFKDLGWTNYFDSMQITFKYKSKTEHMEQILIDLNMTKYEDILFFDDDPDHVKKTSMLNLKAIQVNPQIGMDKNTLIYGLNMFDSRPIK